LSLKSYLVAPLSIILFFSVFERVLVSNSFEVVFVSGKAGLGKSALSNELYKVVAQQDGFFVSGKYDYSNSEPYSGLLEAIKNFCDDLLLEDEDSLDNYRSKIQDAMGQEGRVLTQVISNLHHIIGQQPNTCEVFSQKAKHRFNFVFVNFIKAICSVGPPIIFIL